MPLPHADEPPGLTDQTKAALDQLLQELADIPDWPDARIDPVLLLADLLTAIQIPPATTATFRTPAAMRYLQAHQQATYSPTPTPIP